MKRLVLASILASVLLTFSTLGGMALFGMHGTMGTSADACADHVCSSAEGVVPSGSECLDHCLSVASAFSNVVAPLPIALILLVVLFAVLFSSPVSVSSFQVIDRFREGIGKLLLRRQLATVVLRN